jgi:hypothetical protein
MKDKKVNPVIRALNVAGICKYPEWNYRLAS